MRFAGRITEWNDDKGFGFVVPSGGGTRAFVHISQFQRGARRPVAGDFISYLPVVDERGRTNARQVRHPVEKLPSAKARSRGSRIPRAALGIGALGFAVAAWAKGYLPFGLLAVYLGMSGLSYLMYWHDKEAAQLGRRRERTPEHHLHLADLCDGWPGALIAQRQFHHKTVKQSFQTGFWWTVVLNLAVNACLMKSALAAEWIRSLTE